MKSHAPSEDCPSVAASGHTGPRHVNELGLNTTENPPPRVTRVSSRSWLPRCGAESTSGWRTLPLGCGS